MMEIERNLTRKLPAALPVFQEYLLRMNLEIVPLPASEELEPWSGITADKDKKGLLGRYEKDIWSSLYRT